MKVNVHGVPQNFMKKWMLDLLHVSFVEEELDNTETEHRSVNAIIFEDFAEEM